MGFSNRFAAAAACGWILLPIAGCGESAAVNTGADAGPDGGGFDVAEHLIVPEDAAAEEITVRVMCGVWGCDFPDGEDPWSVGTQEVTTFTAPEEGDYVADWDQYFYYIFASAEGFFTQFFPSVDEGEVFTVDLDGIPEYESAVAGVIFATQSGYQPSLVSHGAIHAIGPGGLEFDFETDASGRYGLHDLPAGGYTFRFEFHEASIDLYVSSGDGLTYDDLYFEDPEQLD